MHTAKSLKAKKKKRNHIVFYTKIENLKKIIYYILACISALITSLLKS
jgi:hypothetical protein